jgi:dienelactone hydrolase
MRSTIFALILWGLLLVPGFAQSTTSIDLRGKSQLLHLYGDKSKPVVLLCSGDLGWAGFVVHVAECLNGKGYAVAGLNTKEYLTSFTTKNSALKETEVMGDFKTLLAYLRQGNPNPVVLAGISEGAGLSVLAATSPEIKSQIQGVVALGLPDQIELGWKWTDFTIWFTKKNPDEPYFLVSNIIGNVSPVPLAEIHSTHDEFLPLDQALKMMGKARQPFKVWVIEASNHRFSNNRDELDKRLLEALNWVKTAR